VIWRLLLILLFLIGCGKKNVGNPVVQQRETSPDGTYVARLYAIQERVAKGVKGKATIEKYGDEFRVTIKLQNAPRGKHPQFLQSGSSCPRMGADLNQDGFVDFEEASPFAGEPLIAFDSDLSSQGGEFPEGSYLYERSVSFSLMISDPQVRAADIKLRSNVVVIYGSSGPLPETVATLEGGQQKESLPIACGELTFGENSEPLPDYKPHSRPRPRPTPRPTIPTRPEITPPVEEEHALSWWPRMRERIRNWKERVGEWWRPRHERDSTTTQENTAI
jgi:hypothetical protein